jgi:glycosyltransferase involved in cell wall biosynthesis
MAGERGQVVYLDANPFADRHLTGIGRYTARIALAIGRRLPLRFFSNGQELFPPPELEWSLDQDLARFGRRIWKSPRERLSKPPAGALGIFPCLRPIERQFDREISILHDFTPQVVPATHSERTRGMFFGFYAKSLLSSDAALAVSHSTRADASWLTDFPQEKIAVCHSGPSLCVERHEDASAVARRPNVGLVVSTLEPRKNAFFLLDWFLQSETVEHASELWWVGPLGWMTNRRQIHAYRKGTTGRRVRFLGVVSDAKLCRLYRTAGWTIYPSLYEGFGFPVLDSLRHGTPVLTSQNSSLREFESPGIFFFDPGDSKTVDQAYLKLRASSSIAIDQARLDSTYDWNRVADALLSMGASQAEKRVRAVLAA